MLLTNHTLTALALTQVFQNPAAIAPLALASHFAIDALPHFNHPKWPFKSRPWLTLATIDNLVALGITITALVIRPEQWLLIVVAVFFASLPDLLFLADIFFKKPIKNHFTRFHSYIQWSQTVPGILGELSWALFMLAVIFWAH